MMKFLILAIFLLLLPAAYQKLGGGWIAPEVIFMVGGKIMTLEILRDSWRR